MAFNISRQPLVPAFLLLAALSIAAACGVGSDTESASAAGQAAIRSAQSIPDLRFEMPGSWLARFLSAWPGWSAAIAGLTILLSGMILGRMAIRYNLHAVNTCIAMPLFGMVACGLPASGNYLTAVVAILLLTLSIKNYARAFCNGYGFNAIFRAAGYQGLLLLLCPATLPLLVLLPLALVLFRRTLREAIVGLFALLLPMLLFCYVNWGAGGSFVAPAASLLGELTSGRYFELFGQISLPALVMLGTVVLLDLFAVVLFLWDLYNVGTKPRFIILFNIGLLLLLAAALCLPGTSSALFTLLAIPSATLLPIVFVRIRQSIALALYLLLTAGAFYGAILQ